MSDLFGNHIVGFPTRWLICGVGAVLSFPPGVLVWAHSNLNGIKFCAFLFKCNLNINQRTNGPVNAHLILTALHVGGLMNSALGRGLYGPQDHRWQDL